MSAAICPELELAAAIAEYTRVTRQTLDHVRYLRKPPASEPLRQCSHQTRWAIGSTAEEDQFFPCSDRATVYNVADDAEYCLRHHQKAEARR